MLDQPEPDDDLHNPNPRRDKRNDGGGSMLTLRGLQNVGCLLIMSVGILGLLYVSGFLESHCRGRLTRSRSCSAGYPMAVHFTKPTLTRQGGFNLGGINSTGQIPDMVGNYGLIDKDTPKEAYVKRGYHNPNEEFVLVFSDEFNTEGRTFYPGDDPYWEAVDLHYWGTVSLFRYPACNFD